MQQPMLKPQSQNTSYIGSINYSENAGRGRKFAYEFLGCAILSYTLNTTSYFGNGAY